MKRFWQKFSYLVPRSKSETGHQATYEGGREWENVYRERWAYDK